MVSKNKPTPYLSVVVVQRRNDKKTSNSSFVHRGLWTSSSRPFYRFRTTFRPSLLKTSSTTVVEQRNIKDNRHGSYECVLLTFRTP